MGVSDKRLYPIEFGKTLRRYPFLTLPMGYDRLLYVYLINQAILRHPSVKEAIMRRTSCYARWFLPTLLLVSLVITACTRPARNDTAATPVMTPLATQPVVVPPEQQTPVVPPPDGQATPATGYPAPQATLDPSLPVATVDPNVPTVDPAVTPVPVATTAPPTTPTTYTVQAGDTMGKIAEQFGLSLQDLIAANPAIPNVDSIQVGDVVNIPGAGTTPAQEGERSHLVQSGDNLYRIGLLYGCTVAELTQFNNLADPNDLEVGQQIRIPVCQ